MFITKSIKEFLIFRESPVLECLKKIEQNKRGIIFVVNQYNEIKGVVSDGDIRRWLTTCSDCDINSPISEVMNENYVFREVKDENGLISEAFSEHIRVIPLVNQKQQIDP